MTWLGGEGASSAAFGKLHNRSIDCSKQSQHPGSRAGTSHAVPVQPTHRRQSEHAGPGSGARSAPLYGRPHAPGAAAPAPPAPCCSGDGSPRRLGSGLAGAAIRLAAAQACKQADMQYSDQAATAHTHAWGEAQKLAAMELALLLVHMPLAAAAASSERR